MSRLASLLLDLALLAEVLHVCSSLLPFPAYIPTITHSYLPSVGGSASCDTAFFVPDDTCVQVGCNASEVSRHLEALSKLADKHLQDNLEITFCGVGTGFTQAGHPSSPCS